MAFHEIFQCSWASFGVPMKCSGELVQARAGTKPISQFSFSDEGAKCKARLDSTARLDAMILYDPSISHPSPDLGMNLPVFLPIYPSNRPSTYRYLSIYPSVYQIHWFIHPSTYPFICSCIYSTDACTHTHTRVTWSIVIEFVYEIPV